MCDIAKNPSGPNLISSNGLNPGESADHNDPV